jgi:K+-sensing histidine kinase KdpD
MRRILLVTKVAHWPVAPHSRLTCVSLLTLIVVTTTLWWLRSALLGAANHPVFFYLVPTAVLAIIYGVGEGALFAVAAFASSAFLLYEPIYSFQVSNHALGELFWFLMTALIGVKCVAELRHHSETS